MLWLQYFRYGKILLVCLAFFGGTEVSGQCFSSSGNPVGGSQNMGTLSRKVLSVIGFHRFSFYDRYFEGGRESDIKILKNANYNYSGILLAYGMTRKLTFEMETGYFINKTKNYRIPADYALKGSGFSTIVISGKAQLINNIEKSFGWSASLGVKTPVKRELQYVDNVRLPFDLQSSTGAFGLAFQSYLMKQNSFTGMRYFMFNRVDINGTSKDGYHYGPSVTNSVFVSKHLIKTSSWPVSITLIFQLRNEIYGRNTIWDEPEVSSGSVKFYASPQVNFSFHEIWNLSLLTDIPVYQHYNNIQLADRIAIGVSIGRAFEFY